MSNDYRAYVENRTNAIWHHGVKGQKWGVRRYQNEDGTLTPEGRARYGEYFDLVAKRWAAHNRGETNLEKLYASAQFKAYDKLVRRGYDSPDVEKMAAKYFRKYRKDNKIYLR